MGQRWKIPKIAFTWSLDADGACDGPHDYVGVWTDQKILLGLTF